MLVPKGWSSGSAPPLPSKQFEAPFWHALQNPELTRLMDLALAQNLDLKAAFHRIEEARALARAAGAPLVPAADVSAGASRTYRDSRRQSSERVLATLSYELDLWGRTRNLAEGARFRAIASQYDREALQLLVAADATTLYAQTLGFEARVGIAERNRLDAEQVLHIIEAQYDAGQVSALEVALQQVAVNDIRVALTTLRQQQVTTRNALAILLGLAPQRFLAPRGDLGALRVPAVDLTPPSALLTRRPDIRSAEAALWAADADIGAARAAFFPSLTLGASTGLGGAATTALSLTADVLAPIFSGGRLEGGLDNAYARQNRLVAQYQKTVLAAFAEVEDALAALTSAQQQLAFFRGSAQQAQTASVLAKLQFEAGAIDYLPVLETQRSLSRTQDALITATVAQLVAFVQLRKALGS